MKQINDNTIVGYDKNGSEIEAEKLQRWAYYQLAAAPDLLEACKLAKGLLEGIDDLGGYKAAHGNVYRDLCEAIIKAEGGDLK